MAINRSRLVRLFRALGNPRKPKSLSVPVPDLIAKTRSQVGTIPIDDCHSILVSIAKLLKSTNLKNRLDSHIPDEFFPHPVILAPLARELITRILSAECSFRTVSGTFGLVHRLGIDWFVHLPVSEREPFIQYIKTQFAVLMEQYANSGTRPDLAAIGYCCETATVLGLTCPEFYEYVEEVVVSTTDVISPLSVVQMLEFLTCSSNPDQRALVVLFDRIAAQPMSFTAQNLVKILSAMVVTDTRDANLLASICRNLTQNASKMRITDCAAVLQSISILAETNVESLGNFARAMQRRCTVLTVTSRSPLPLSTAYSIMSSLHKMAMITGTSSPAMIRFNSQSLKFLGV